MQINLEKSQTPCRLKKESKSTALFFRTTKTSLLKLSLSRRCVVVAFTGVNCFPWKCAKMKMDQDELEDEILTKTLWTHLHMLAKHQAFWSRSKDPLFYYHLAVAISSIVCIWLLISGRFSRLKQRLFWHLGLGNVTDYIWKDTLGNGAAAFSLQGRRPTMEDRYVMIDIPPPENSVSRKRTKLYSVMDGHGGEFSAVYTKKHLIQRLTSKIKLLQVLQQLNAGDKRTTIQQYHNLTKMTSPSKQLLKYFDVTQDEYHLIIGFSPPTAAKTARKPADSDPTRPVVLSSRVKPLEELPKHNNNVIEKDFQPGSVHNDMLSPYSNLPKRNHSKSPNNRNASLTRKDSGREITQPLTKDLTEYLIRKNGSSFRSIDYANLIRDEIATVDIDLIVEAKRRMHVGGLRVFFEGKKYAFF